MKKIIIIAFMASSLFLFGCGTKISEPTQIGDNLYNIDTEIIQAFTSSAEMKAKDAAIAKAKEFCASMNKQIETRQIKAFRTEDGATASIQFECR